MSPEPSASQSQIGPELISHGCRQGALLEAPARMIWLREANGSIAEDNVDDALLVVISQDCDINAAAKAEPRVEALTARWSENPSEIHTARKGNSARLFLLKDSGDRALLADARRRVHLEKQGLLSARFTSVLDERNRARFAGWVAGRYNRPAVANELVDGILKPVIKALDVLFKSKSSLLKLIDRLAEIRFLADGTARWTVDFIVMTDEGDELTAEEEADFAGWLEETLVVDGGPVQEIRIAFRQAMTVSLHDYLQTTRLQLDQYSPEPEAELAS